MPSLRDSPLAPPADHREELKAQLRRQRALPVEERLRIFERLSRDAAFARRARRVR